MARDWTDKQRDAINTRDRTLLISAAAGSGKTATLTERVIASILDKENPIEVNQILAVTFTNAAALELRAKITERVASALRDCGESITLGAPDENMEDGVEMEEDRVEEMADKTGESTVAYLRRQLELLPLAHIRTIDSFCNEILKQNTASVNIPPNYRIAEEAEILLLSHRVMDGLMEGVLHGIYPDIGEPEEFLNLIDAMVGVKQEEKIIPAFLYIYDKTKTHEDGVYSLFALVDEYLISDEKPFEETTFGSYLISEIVSYAKAYAVSFDKYFRALEDMGDDASLKVINVFRPFRDKLLALAKAKTYEEMRDLIFSIDYINLQKAGLPKGEKRTADMVAIIELYKEMRELFEEKFAERFFTYTKEALIKLCGDMHRTLSLFVRFLVRFDELFVAQKKQMGIAEHSDIERYAYECLYNKETGEPTEYAISLRDSFRAVYIDEYQDVNRLQDRIFEMIATPDNRFMVGDIKQSIYSFRSAAPGIFAEMKEKFPIFTRERTDKGPASIFMSDNFRCDRGVVDFVNEVFDCVFGLTGESIQYVSEDALRCSKYRENPTDEPPYLPSELLLVEGPPQKKKDPEGIAEETLSSIECEARVVANRILEIFEKKEKRNDGEEITYGDIAILLRSTKTKAKVFGDALEKVGIPYAITQGDDFFLSPEVLLALCILNVVDNPQRDIYLAGLLLSPLYGFTADEVAKIRGIRKEKVEGPLIFALQEYAKAHPEHLRTQKFLSDLARYRAEAEGVGVDVLLSKLYYETGLITIASTHGGLDNLMLLHNFAGRFEKNGFRGLYAFIQYINDIIKKEEKIDNRPEVPKGANLVQIITIHASKGLEYPICFVAGAGTQIRDGDVKCDKGTLEFSEGFGLSLRLRDATGLISLDNPILQIIKRRRMDLIFEEEMRILYVALTRARERLIVSGVCSTKLDEFENKMDLLRERLSPEIMRAQRTYIGPILLSGTKAKKTRDYRAEGEVYTTFDDEDGARVDEEEELREFDFYDTPEREGEETLKEKLIKRFSYRYPCEIYTKLPAKLSVSFLKPTILDGNESEEKETLYIEDAIAEESELSEVKKLISAGDILTPFDDPVKEDTPFGIKKGEVGEIPEEGSQEENGETTEENATEKQTIVDILPEFYTENPLDKPARAGTATHIMFQFADFERLYRTSAEEELARLVEEQFIGKKDSTFVRLREVERFRFSKLMKRMRKAKEMWREFRFHATLPASLFTRNEEKKEKLEGIRLLVQGVIDCLFEDENGALVLIDYKTDRIPGEIWNDREKIKEFFTDRHHQQLFYYTLAIEQMFGKRPDIVEIYSTVLGDTIEIEV